MCGCQVLCDAGALGCLVDSLQCHSNLMLVESAADAVAAVVKPAATGAAGIGLAPYIQAGGLEVTVSLLGAVPADDVSICAPTVAILAALVVEPKRKKWRRKWWRKWRYGGVNCKRNR